MQKEEVTPPASTLPNKKVLKYGGARAINDQEVIRFMEGHLSSEYLLGALADKDIVTKFLNEYRHWIESSQLNNLTGWANYPFNIYSLGTTESFDKWYLKFADRRFRCFRGEYMYHILSWRNFFPNWKYVDEEDLCAGDALVISMPFADSGEIHPKMIETLDKCAELDIPVLIDMAYFGNCQGLEFDLGHPAIDCIVTSLSKTFPVAHLRIGMRFTRTDDDDPLFVYHKTNYQNRMGAAVGYELVRNFNADRACNKWSGLQKEICTELGATPSQTVFFGLGDSQYNDYSRAGMWNRLYLGGEFESRSKN